MKVPAVVLTMVETMEHPEIRSHMRLADIKQFCLLLSGPRTLKPIGLAYKCEQNKKSPVIDQSSRMLQRWSAISVRVDSWKFWEKVQNSLSATRVQTTRLRFDLTDQPPQE
jgi:hypothetical protein